MTYNYHFVMKSAACHFSQCSPQASDLDIDLVKTHKPKPDLTGLAFGTVFTDHMLTVEWSSQAGWQKPRIHPFGNLSIHPACSALHYAIQVSCLALVHLTAGVSQVDYIS